MHRVAVLVCALSCACGRLNFDPAVATSDGATDSANDPPIFFTQTFVKASNTDPGDQFGLSVALSSDGYTLAVGAPLESSASRTINSGEGDNTALEAGAVYVFRKVGDTWMQEAYLKASNADPDDQFGWGIGLSGDGDTLIVGARHEDSNGTGQLDNSALSAGAAYVFTRVSSTWSQTAFLKAQNPEASDAFGTRVAMSSDGATAVIGAMYEDGGTPLINGNQADNSLMDAGAVYVFSRQGVTWTQQAYVKASNPDTIDEFGQSLGLSEDGNTLVVGAYREDSAATGVGGDANDDSLVNAGAVYIYTRAGTIWSFHSYLKASNPDLGDNFGYHVSIAGNGSRMVATATSESSSARGVGGIQTDDSLSASGAAYEFELANGTWSQRAYMKASNADAQDIFGFSTSLNTTGGLLASSAIGEQSGLTDNELDNSANGAGAMYVLDVGGGWHQRRYLKAANPGIDDKFGWATALSGSGNTLAVSAPYEDSSGTGVNGVRDEGDTDSGAVYLFD